MPMIAFGWGSSSFREQLPTLPEKDALAFDADNQAVIRLHVRGFITDSQRDAAIKKITREIGRALSKAEGR